MLTDSSHRVVFSTEKNNIFLIHPEHGLFELDSLQDISISEAKNYSSRADSSGFSTEMIEYLRSQPTDLDRAQYVYGLGRAALNWPEERSIEHLEAIRLLSGYIGKNSNGAENLEDWEDYLYPLALMTDAWNALEQFRFTFIDLIDAGMSKELALGFGEIFGVLRGGLVYGQVDPSSIWAAIIFFVLGTVAERSNSENFPSLVEASMSAIELMAIPEEMMELVQALFAEPVFPGH